MEKKFSTQYDINQYEQFKNETGAIIDIFSLNKIILEFPGPP